MTNVTLKEFQERAVTRVANNAKDFLEQPPSEDKVIVLHSPTGSGKTVMLGHIIDRSLKDCITIVLSPGKGDLEQQTLNRLKSVCTEVEVKRLDNTVTAQRPRKGTVVVSNWEALVTRDKKTGKYKVSLSRESEERNIFDWLSLAARAGIKVAIIVDEAHHGAKKTAEGIKSFLEDIAASMLVTGHSGETTHYSPLFIEASATPLRTDSNGVKNFAKIEVSHHDVIEAGLMRRHGVLNQGVGVKLAEMDEEKRASVGSETLLLDAAWRQLQEINAEYKKVGSKYHGLLAIQIPNSKEGNLATERIQEFFKAKEVSVEKGNLAIFTSSTKQGELGDIASPESPIQVLLYKMAISTGWDCPRAQVLVGFRHLNSKVFTVQNLGRIARTTEAKHYNNDILDQFYVYSNINDLGLNHFSEAVVDGMPDYLSYVEANPEYIKAFNKLNLPYFTFRRTNRNAVKPGDITTAVIKAFKTEGKGTFVDLYEYESPSATHNVLSTGRWSTEDVMSNEAAASGQTSQTVAFGDSITVVREKLLTHIESIIAETGREFGPKRPIANRLLSILIVQMIRSVFNERGVIRQLKFSDGVENPHNLPSNVWVLRQLDVNRDALTALVNTVLNDEEIVIATTDAQATAEDSAKRELREFKFLGSFNMSQWIPVSRAGKYAVSPQLAEQYLYHLPKREEDESRAEAWMQEELTDVEIKFENNFLVNVKSRKGVTLDWFFKNPPRGDSDFSIALTRGDKAIPFFPDYILRFTINGKVIHAIIEAKPDNIDGVDPNARAKGTAALEYSRHTGIPFAVVHQVNGQWRVVSEDTNAPTLTLEEYLFERTWGEPKEQKFVEVDPNRKVEDIPEEFAWIQKL